MTEMGEFGPGQDWDARAHVRLLRTNGGASSGYTADLIERLYTELIAAALASRPSQGGEWVMVGDTVRVLRARNAYGENVDVGKPVAIGETFVVGEIQDDTTYPCRIVFPQGEHTDFWREDDLASLSASPSPYGVEELVERAFKDGLAYGSNVEGADPETAWMQSRVRASLGRRALKNQESDRG